MKTYPRTWRWLLISYQLLFMLSLPIWIVRLWLKSRRHVEHRQHLGERFGQVPIPPAGQNVIWLHAVSLGESVSITPWIQDWLLKHTTDILYLTVTTPTGRAHFKKYFAHHPNVRLSYLPWDQYYFLQRFFKRVQPKLLILVESELWPMMLWLCHQKQCPVMMVNARLSQKSAQRYQRLSPYIHPLFEAIEYIGTQTRTSVSLFRKVCPAKTQIEAIGNLKFDRSTLSQPPKRAHYPPIWMMASTHEGEEKQALHCHQQLQRTCPSAILILAPRHPERFERVAQYCDTSQIPYKTHQQAGSALTPGTVHLVNAMGVLNDYYQQAQMVMIGGTFVPIGGHNPLEAAACAAAVMVGPYTDNCRDSVGVLEAAGGLVVCQDEAAWLSQLLAWCRQPEQCAQVGRQAWQVMTDNQGASARFMARVQSRWLSSSH